MSTFFQVEYIVTLVFQQDIDFDTVSTCLTYGLRLTVKYRVGLLTPLQLLGI